MSLRGYKPKTRPAPWRDAFPDQAPKPVAPRFKRIPRVAPRSKAKNAEYTREAREFVANLNRLGSRCPVVTWARAVTVEHGVGFYMAAQDLLGMKYGHPVCDRINEVHHKRGRLGSLLLDKRGWLGVSKRGHRWIHRYPMFARALGFLAGPGEWNKAYE